MPAPEKSLNISVKVDARGAIKQFGKVTMATEKVVRGVTRLTTATHQLGGTTTVVTRKFDQYGKSVAASTNQVKQLNRGLFKTGDSFGKIIMKVTQWTVATGILFGSIRALKGGLDTIVDIDDKMVMLNKVFQGTKDQLAEVRQEAMRVSVSMGNLVGSSIEATTEWAKMGRVGSELSEGLRVSLLGQNIAEIDAAEGAKLLNAAMLQFSINMDDAIGILDEWNELSNRTPVTTRDLAASVQQAGAIFNSAGANIQDLNAYTAALGASMAKSGKEVGSALKTIGSYIRRQSSIPKILKIAGVAIEREAGQLMDLDNIILQLSGRWQSLTDIEKEEIAQTAAGVRRKAFFINLMENFNLVLEDYVIQWQAAGSAIEENEIRMDSLKTKLLQLSAAVEEMAIKTGDKGLLKIMKNVVDSTQEMVSSFGNLSGVMQLTTIGMGILGAGLTKHIALSVKSAAAWALLGPVLSATTAGFLAFASGLIVLGEIAFITQQVVIALTAQETALKKLNEQRAKSIGLIKAEKAEMRAAKQQYQVFKDLVASLDQAKANGDATAVIMDQIKLIWNSINDIDPTILGDAETIKEVLEALKTKAEEADVAMQKLLSGERRIKLEQDIQLLFKQTDLKDQIEKFVEDSRVITRKALPSGMSISAGYEKSIPFIDPGNQWEQLPDEKLKQLLKFAKNGEIFDAIELLEKFKESLRRSTVPAGPDSGNSIKRVQALIDKIKELDKAVNEGPDGGDGGKNGAYDSKAWAAMASELGRVLKRADALDARLQKIRDKSKTSAELFSQALRGGNLSGSVRGADNGDAIRSSVASMEADIIAREAEITALETKKTDENAAAIEEKTIALAGVLDIYKLLLEALTKLNSEENAEANVAERAAKAAERRLDAERKAQARARITEQKATDRKTERSIEASRRASQEVLDTFSVNIGETVGSAIGAGIRSDRVYSAMNTMTNDLGDLLGERLGNRLSVYMGKFVGDSLALGLGGVAGAGVGALFSILADSLFGEKSQSDKLIDEMDRNTLALQDNTDAFQDFQERLINAPSTFALPALAGDSTSGYGGGDTVDFMSKGIGGSGGGNTSTTMGDISISIDGSKSPIETGKAVVAAIDKAYSNSDDRGKNLAQDF